MNDKNWLVVGIALTVFSLLIGIAGIAVFIGVGEAANNGLVAIAAVSFPFALLAGIFAWIAPRARWAIAIAMSGPVALLGVLGSWSGGYLLLGAVWTVALTCAGAAVGNRLNGRKGAG